MKHIQTFESFLNEAVSVDASKYVRAHGKKPKGNGMWGFEIKGQEVFTPTAMDYTAAQKWAKEEGKKLNAITPDNFIEQCRKNGYTGTFQLKLDYI